MKYEITDDLTDDAPVTPERRAEILAWHESVFHPPSIQTTFHEGDAVADMLEEPK